MRAYALIILCDGTPLLGIETGRESSRVDEIAEEDGELATLGLECRRFGAVPCRGVRRDRRATLPTESCIRVEQRLASQTPDLESSAALGAESCILELLGLALRAGHLCPLHLKFQLERPSSLAIDLCASRGAPLGRLPAGRIRGDDLRTGAPPAWLRWYKHACASRRP